MPRPDRKGLSPSAARRRTVLLMAATALPGCAWVPGSGPSRRQVQAQASRDAGRTAEQIRMANAHGIRLVPVTRTVIERLRRSALSATFAEAFPRRVDVPEALGRGDVLELLVWEAPPASLFGSASLDLTGSTPTARGTALPPQVVSRDGTIRVPFVGAVRAAGRTPREVEADIIERLRGKANQPQVMVQVTERRSALVTVVGEVTNSQQLPITPRGEHLLDALATAGGVRQPVNRMTVQLTRGRTVVSMPLEKVIADPRQNVPLVAGDVVTAIQQPGQFTVLGATGRNAQVGLQGQGMSAIQAIAEAGGVLDGRSDPSGLFVFRMEDPAVFAADGAAVATAPAAAQADDRGGAASASTAAEPTAGKGDGASPVPPPARAPVGVIYSFDLKDPATFFLGQRFAMRDEDILYVSVAPIVELQKFLGLLTSLVYPLENIRTLYLNN